MTFPVLPRIAGPISDISLSSLAAIPSPSQNMVVWVKDFYSPGVGRLKLTYDPAGNATYPWRVDDISNGGTMQSGAGFALPPNAGDNREDVPSRFKLPCAGIWNVKMSGTWDGVNVTSYWSSNGLLGGAGGGVVASPMEDFGWHTISLPTVAALGSYSSLWASKSGSGSGGIQSGYWNGYPSRIIAP